MTDTVVDVVLPEAAEKGKDDISASVASACDGIISAEAADKTTVRELAENRCISIELSRDESTAIESEDNAMATLEDSTTLLAPAINGPFPLIEELYGRRQYAVTGSRREAASRRREDRAVILEPGVEKVE